MLREKPALPESKEPRDKNLAALYVYPFTCVLVYFA